MALERKSRLTRRMVIKMPIIESLGQRYNFANQPEDHSKIKKKRLKILLHFKNSSFKNTKDLKHMIDISGQLRNMFAYICLRSLQLIWSPGFSLVHIPIDCSLADSSGNDPGLLWLIGNFKASVQELE